MINAVLLDEVSLAADDLDLSAWHSLDLNLQRYSTTAPNQLIERISDAQIALTNKVVFSAQEFKQLEHLKLIVVLGTGTNNIDLQAAKKAGVRVCHMVDYSTESVAQHVFSVMLAQATKLLEYRRAIADGEWQKSDFFGLLDYPAIELSGSTLGLIGYGAIAKRVEHIAQAFNMHVVVAQSLNPNADQPSAEQKSTRQRTPLKKLLQDSDFISIHCPLNQHTKDLIASEELSLMKSSAYLINAARGGIVNEQALADALRSRQIAGAAIDVLTQEPPTSEHVLMADAIPNLILTPHSAWSSQRSRQNLVDQTYAILKAWSEEGDVQIQRAI